MSFFQTLILAGAKATFGRVSAWNLGFDACLMVCIIRILITLAHTKTGIVM
jgi:hypothetical protein